MTVFADDIFPVLTKSRAATIFTNKISNGFARDPRSLALCDLFLLSPAIPDIALSAISRSLRSPSGSRRSSPVPCCRDLSRVMSSFAGSGSRRAPSSTPTASASFDSYQFDFGIGPGSSSPARPLKDQKLNPNAPSSNHLFSSSKPVSASSASSWNASLATRPSWTHQPAAAARSGLLNPLPCMAGDIFGRNWSSSNPAAATSSNLGIPNKNPNLFSDLVGSSISQGRAAQNVPLNSAPPKNSSFSMSDFNTNNPGRPNSVGSFSSSIQSDSKIGGPALSSPMKLAVGFASNSKTDPFGSLAGFGLKTAQNMPLSSGKSSGSGSGVGSFSAFQNTSIAQKPQQPQQSNRGTDFPLGGFQKPNMNDFGMPGFPPPPQQLQPQVIFLELDLTVHEFKSPIRRWLGYQRGRGAEGQYCSFLKASAGPLTALVHVLAY